jgi:transposase InsO family protein
MRRQGIRALAGRRFRPCTTDSRHDRPVAPDLLKQLFSAALPNTVWLADITDLPTGEGWLHLAAILDPATRKSVGRSMRDHMRTELISAALTMATQRQRPEPASSVTRIAAAKTRQKPTETSSPTRGRHPP